MDNDIATWFNNISVSPSMFPQNSIVSADKVDDTIIMTYNPEMTTGCVFLPVVSLTAIPVIYKIGIRKPDSQAHSAPEVCIYGSVYVDNGGLINDEIIDESLVSRFSISDDSCKFKSVVISGTFGDYNSMVNCINLLYDRLTDKAADVILCLYLESRFMKDTGEMVTLAEAISSGYVPHNISDDIKCNLEYIFKKFSVYERIGPIEKFDENYTHYSQFNE